MAKALPVLGVDPDNTLRANAALIIPVRAAELIAWERHIDDPARVAELHQMRIAAKRLRYTMELFAPFYGPDFAAAIDRIKAIQEQLGSIHDADVLVPELWVQSVRVLKPSRKRKKKSVPGVHCADFDAAAGLIALCRRKQTDRQALYGKFLATWRKMRANGFFETLRAMVREASTEVVVRPLKEGERNGKRKTSRRPVGARARSERADERDTGAGADPGAGAEEDRPGQHSLFEEGDAR